MKISHQDLSLQKSVTSKTIVFPWTSVRARRSSLLLHFLGGTSTVKIKIFS